MADTERKFSELSVAGTLTDNDILALSQTDIGTSTLISVRATLIAIATHIAKVAAFTNDLDTTSKTLIGAINELKQLISLIPQFSIDVVQTLPVSDISETTIYLVPSSDPRQGNYYEEYIYVNNTWELVGTTAVDLSAYYTKLEVDGLLSAKANTSDVTAALALKETKADMDDDVTDIVVGLTDEQTTTAGNPVTLTTEQSGGAKSAVVTFTPVQSGSGDPSPENVRPISGWDSLHLYQGGVNVISSVLENNYIYNNGTVSTSTIADLLIAPIEQGKKYTVKTSADNAYYGIFTTEPVRGDVAYNNIRTEINLPQYTFTAPITGYIACNTKKGTASNCCIIEGEPTTHTATIDAPTLGGSYDFVSGKLTITDVSYLIKDLTWSYSSSNAYFAATIRDMKTYETGANVELLSECYKNIGSLSNNTAWGEAPTNSIGTRNNQIYIYIKDTRYSTQNELKDAMGDYRFTIKLAAPIEITLTPEDIELLKGSNTVWSDANGTVTVGYAKLPNGNLGAVVDYIKKLEARISALES